MHHTYNIILTSEDNGEAVKIRIRLPMLQSLSSYENSTWHAEGGKLKYANGTCHYLKDWKSIKDWGLTRPSLALVSMGEQGIMLKNFFSILHQHNSGGGAEIVSGWGGSTMVPGKASWCDDD